MGYIFLVSLVIEVIEDVALWTTDVCVSGVSESLVNKPVSSYI